MEPDEPLWRCNAMREMVGFLDDPRLGRFGHHTVVRPMPAGWRCEIHPAAQHVIVGVIDADRDLPAGRQITCRECYFAAQRSSGFAWLPEGTWATCFVPDKPA